MSFCPNCGASNESGNKFCMFCGSALDEPAAVAVPVDNAEPVQPEPVQTIQATPIAAPIQAQPVSQPIAAPVQPVTSGRISSAYTAPASTNGLCIAGMVVSLVSILCCGLLSWLGFLLSLIGLIVACAKKQRGKGMAITGLIVSVILMGLLAFLMFGNNRTFKKYMRDAGLDDTFDWMDDNSRDDDDDDDDYDYKKYTSATDDDDDDDDDDRTYDKDKDLDIDTGWAHQKTTMDSDGEIHTTITYTDGIPDSFVLYGNTTFGDVSKAIKENNQIKDSISQQVREFDIETFRRVCTLYWFGPDEYANMKAGSDRQTCLASLAYLATLSFEFTCDKFVPDYAEYENLSTVYEYHGILDKNNIGHSTIVFNDGSQNVYFDEAMCGDEIVWTFDFGHPDTFKIGMTASSQKDYPAGRFVETANYFGSLIDPVLK